MRYITFLYFSALLLGCAFTPVFQNTAESELNSLSNSLTNTRLEDLFRVHPTLRFVNSTNIGNGNMRHGFTYAVIEKEDESKRPITSNDKPLYERHITFSINIFVDASGVIYEVLTPIPTHVEIIETGVLSAGKEERQYLFD